MSATTKPRVTSGRYVTVNPATGEEVAEFDQLTDQQAEELLTRAHIAFGKWRGTAILERARLLSQFADILDANSEALARLTTLEMGKPLAQAVVEVTTAARMFRYYAEHGPALLADLATPLPGFSSAVTRREPLGVVLGIEPWNAPLYQAMRAAAPNLMLGNTVIVKPAEICAGSTSFLDRLFVEAGIPDDVYTTALLSVEQVSTYIADSRVRAVTLTGSDRAGAEVGAQAGRHIKPVVLELGGSDAFIVLDSADVEKAASTAAICRTRLGGQACASPKRLIVTESVAEEFTSRFVAQFSDFVLGDPFDPKTTVGPLSSRRSAELLQEQYQDAVDKGARVFLAGGLLDGPGAFFSPAVIGDITPEMRVFSEEAFGPLAMIHRVGDADAAIELANGSSYGLGGTVFGADLAEAHRVAGSLDTGGVGINNYLGAPIDISFGGTKRSGVGRELGPFGMDQFANLKTYGLPEV